MNVREKKLKRVAHFCCILVIMLIFIISIINLFIPRDYLKDSLKNNIIVFDSLFFIFCSFVFIIIGMLLPKKEKMITPKIKGIFLVLQLISGMISGHYRIGVPQLRKSTPLRRQWNSPGILIMGVFLLAINFFTSMVVAESHSFNLFNIFQTLIVSPYGKILIAQFIGWLLLIVTSFIWYYYDWKSRIEVPEDVINQKQENNKKLMVQCNYCSTVFKYEIYNGFCPECHKYNRPSNTYYNENAYRSKKSFLESFKTAGLILLIFSGIIIATIIKYYIDSH